MKSPEQAPHVKALPLYSTFYRKRLSWRILYTDNLYVLLFCILLFLFLEQIKWSQAIQRNIRNIFQDLDSDDVIWFLLQERAITTEDLEEIENQPGSNKKASPLTISFSSNSYRI